MSRKRVPPNQNECTADFRIGVPFEQNLQVALKRVEQYIEEKPLNVEKTRSKEEKGKIQKNKSQKRREDMMLLTS